MVLARLRIAFILIAPMVLFAIPLATLASTPPLCLFRLLFDMTCPGCGMTRALHEVLHLNFAHAFVFNRGVVFVAPLLAWISLRSLWVDIRRLYFRDISLAA